MGMVNVAIHQRLQPYHLKNNGSWYTIVHGDLKGANIAFSGSEEGKEGERERERGREGGDKVVEAAAYDFQWSGGGLGCQDVAYFMISAVDPSALLHEEMLLREYYDQRVAAVASSAASAAGSGSGSGSRSKSKRMSYLIFRKMYNLLLLLILHVMYV